jgi:hypothetical protein
LAALITLLVYEKLGVALLRRAWFNLDLILVHGFDGERRPDYHDLD